ncbi:restriction endonuclease subunit S [Sorangium sp. So ce1667]
MSELPNGWARFKLNDLAAPARNALTIGPFGSNLKVSDYRDEGVPLIFVRDIRSESFGGPKTKYVTLEKASELGSHTARPGDLLVTKMGDPPGDTSVYPDGYPLAVITADCIKMTPGPMTTAVFLKHWLRCEALRDRILEETKGVAQQKLSLDRFRNIEVEIPPLEEQHRIVAKLETLTTQSRRAKEALDAIPALLERFRQSVLAAAFRGDLTADWREKNPDVEPAEELLERIRAERRRRWEEAEFAKMRAKGKVPGDDRWKERYEEPAPVDASELPELPEGWAWAALGELAWDAGYGTSEKCDYGGEGAPVLRIPNVARGKLDLTDLKRAVQRVHLDPDEALQPGDLLIVRTNGSKELIGRAALAHDRFKEPHYFASYLIRFRLPNAEHLSRWTEAIWSAPQVRLSIEQMAATSAGQYNISLGNLNGLPLPIPPTLEQAEITRKIMSSLSFVERLGTLLADAQEQQHTLDRSILAKAFRGELVPQDPNDEPASALLERIRAEVTSNGQPTDGARRPRKPAPPESSKPSTTGRGRKPATSSR